MKSFACCLSSLLFVVLTTTPSPAAHDRNKAVIEEHRIPHGPLPTKHQTHASTITEAADGTLIAAWFAGTRENAPDVKIWASRKTPDAKAWAEPVVVDDGSRGGKQYATWNPVLFTNPKDGTVYLWYKITGDTPEPGYRNWWGAVRTSTDHGKSWSKRIWLPKVDAEKHPILKHYGSRATGPVKNRPIVMPDGSLLCGSSTENEPLGWRTHFEVYQRGDWTGQKHGVKIVGPLAGRAIQPSLIVVSPDHKKLGAFTRDNGITWSEDGGQSWTPVAKSPVTTAKGLHAVTTTGGWHFLTSNPTASRTPLQLSRSKDGKTWTTILPTLRQDGRKQMDYPTMMQSKDGRLHIVHSYGRGFIHHIVLDTDYLSGDGE